MKVRSVVVVVLLTLGLTHAPAAQRATAQSVVASIAATPRVGATGSRVLLSGTCDGSARVRLIGQPVGWKDVPPVYVDTVVVSDITGSWSTSATMPNTPATARVDCLRFPTTSSASALIAPFDGNSALLGFTSAASGVVVTIPRVSNSASLVASTAGGEPVPLTVLDPSVTVLLQPPAGARRIVIVGIEDLGENAEALQVSRVQAWFVDLPVSPPELTAGVPTIGLLPAQRLTATP